MSCTTGPEALFRVCLQDLRAGRLLGVEQLPEIAARVGSPLADEITELTRVYQDEIAQLQELGGAGEAPENLWMGGILDDAKRDTETIAPGSLLEIAIVGAVRKALSADAVSLETAEAVADNIARQSAAQTINRMKMRAREMDGRLRELLFRLASGATPSVAE